MQVRLIGKNQSDKLSNVRMWNEVSLQWLGVDTTLEWYHKIDSFVAMPRFIPRGRNKTTDIGMPALGPQMNQLPQDLDVTFFFDYVKGNTLSFS